MTKTLHFGQLIDDFSKAQEWTRDELQDILEISNSNMYKKLRMKDIDTEYLRRVAGAAGVEVWQLVRFGEVGMDAGEPVESISPNNLQMKLWKERVTSLENENKLLRQQIDTLNKLISNLEKEKI